MAQDKENMRVESYRNKEQAIICCSSSPKYPYAKKSPMKVCTLAIEGLIANGKLQQPHRVLCSLIVCHGLKV